MIRPFLASISCLALSSALVTAQEKEAPQDSVFGSSKKTAGSMLGIFYDLKQNPKRQPLPNGDDLRTLGRFLDSGWDESVLSRYFRATKPLYATEVLIPTMSADAAPAAYGLTGVVRPSHWFVIYKAQVSPPEDGTYRFVGIADDVMAVGVNGKTVLVSNFGGHPNHSRWKEPSPSEDIKVWAGNMKRGDWFTCKKTDIIDLDILIGEIPGSLFGAWLLIEKKGETYPTTKDGRPEIPVFQVKAKPVAQPTGGNTVPFSVNSKPWTCHP